MRDTESGFTLTEALVAALVTTVGVMMMVSVFVYGIRLEAGANDGTRANNIALSELERIRMLPVSNPERSVGGSLTANIANHFVVRGDTTIRWTIADGPACGPSIWAGPTMPVECAKDVSVVAFPRNRQAVSASVQARLWR